MTESLRNISFPFDGGGALLNLFNALSHKASTEKILTGLNVGFYTKQRLHAPALEEQTSELLLTNAKPCLLASLFPCWPSSP